jgi:hypothetical protein
VLDRFELAVTRPFQERRQLFWRQSRRSPAVTRARSSLNAGLPVPPQIP